MNKKFATKKVKISVQQPLGRVFNMSLCSNIYSDQFHQIICNHQMPTRQNFQPQTAGFRTANNQKLIINLYKLMFKHANTNTSITYYLPCALCVSTSSHLNFFPLRLVSLSFSRSLSHFLNLLLLFYSNFPFWNYLNICDGFNMSYLI